MPTRLELTRQPEFSGTLPFSFAPGGELTFADGVTTVPDDDPLEWLSRYPALDVVNESDAPAETTAADTAESADKPLALDPSNYSVSDLRDALSVTDLSVSDLEATLAAEESGKDRDTATEAIRGAMADAEE